MKIGVIVWAALILFIGACICPEIVIVCVLYFIYQMYNLLK